jgi:hypothetical protein
MKTNVSSDRRSKVEDILEAMREAYEKDGSNADFEGGSSYLLNDASDAEVEKAYKKWVKNKRTTSSLIQAARLRVNTTYATASSNVFGAKGEKLPPRWKSLLSKIAKLMKAADLEPAYDGDFEGTPSFTMGKSARIVDVANALKAGGFKLIGPSHGTKGFKSYLLATANEKTIFSVHGWDKDQNVSIGSSQLEGSPLNADLSPESLLTGKTAFEEATGLKFKMVISKKTGRLMLKAPISGRIHRYEALEALAKIGGKKKVSTMKGRSVTSMLLHEYGCRAIVVLPSRAGDVPPQMWIF